MINSVLGSCIIKGSLMSKLRMWSEPEGTCRHELYLNPAPQLRAFMLQGGSCSPGKCSRVNLSLVIKSSVASRSFPVVFIPENTFLKWC